VTIFASFPPRSTTTLVQGCNLLCAYTTVSYLGRLFKGLFGVFCFGPFVYLLVTSMWVSPWEKTSTFLGICWYCQMRFFERKVSSCRLNGTWLCCCWRSVGRHSNPTSTSPHIQALNDGFSATKIMFAECLLVCGVCWVAKRVSQRVPCTIGNKATHRATFSLQQKSFHYQDHL
jgi:hypothetical protein